MPIVDPLITPATDIDRWTPRQRPAHPPAGWQSWRELLFLHWEVDPQVVRPLVPEPLQLDLVGGRAFIGLVPFQMANVRSVRWPWRLTADFGETNVRTYVIHRGRPGVYFLSLDAASLLATLGARIGWGLPYFWSRISSQRTGSQVHYRVDRHFNGARLQVAYELLAPAAPLSETAPPAKSVGRAEAVAEIESPGPAGLADFLLERYLLFVVRGGRVWEGQVHHRPYPVSPVRLLSVEQTLLTAAGISTDGAWPDHVHWSPGVDVEIFPLRRVV
ncbi:MAG: DUF2071 domain-containing protein [Pirellulales bacterium]